MSQYTELIFGATFKDDTPIEVINTLRYMVGDIDLVNTTLPFKYEHNPLMGGSIFFGVSEEVSVIKYDDFGQHWYMSTRANIKNYSKDIERFLEWIKPYIASGSGMRYMYAIVTEEDGEPTLYFLEDE